MLKFKSPIIHLTEKVFIFYRKKNGDVISCHRRFQRARRHELMHHEVELSQMTIEMTFYTEYHWLTVVGHYIWLRCLNHISVLVFTSTGLFMVKCLYVSLTVSRMKLYINDSGDMIRIMICLHSISTTHALSFSNF